MSVSEGVNEGVGLACYLNTLQRYNFIFIYTNYLTTKLFLFCYCRIQLNVLSLHKQLNKAIMNKIFELALRNAEVKVKAEVDVRNQVLKSKIEVMDVFSKPILEFMLWLNNQPDNIFDGRKLLSSCSNGEPYLNNFKGLYPTLSLLNISRMWEIKCSIDDNLKCKVTVSSLMSMGPNTTTDFYDFESFMLHVCGVVADAKQKQRERKGI